MISGPAPRRPGQIATPPLRLASWRTSRSIVRPLRGGSVLRIDLTTHHLQTCEWAAEQRGMSFARRSAAISCPCSLASTGEGASRQRRHRDDSPKTDIGAATRGHAAQGPGRPTSIPRGRRRRGLPDHPRPLRPDRVVLGWRELLVVRPPAAARPGGPHRCACSRSCGRFLASCGTRAATPMCETCRFI